MKNNSTDPEKRQYDLWTEWKKPDAFELARIAGRISQRRIFLAKMRDEGLLDDREFGELYMRTGGDEEVIAEEQNLLNGRGGILPLEAPTSLLFMARIKLK